MKFEIELNDPGSDCNLREVEVPDKEMEDLGTVGVLDLVFMYGQNDFQPKANRSVSPGDVIRFNGRRFVVEAMGFEELKEKELSARSETDSHSSRPRSIGGKTLVGNQNLNTNGPKECP